MIKWLTGVMLAMLLLATPAGIEVKACSDSSATVFSFTLEDDTGEAEEDTGKSEEDTVKLKEGITQQQDGSKENSSPETGDDSQVLIWAAVFIASGIFAVVKIKKPV